MADGSFLMSTNIDNWKPTVKICLLYIIYNILYIVKFFYHIFTPAHKKTAICHLYQHIAFLDQQ